MTAAVRYIRAVGIHGRYDLELEFYSDVSIVYAINSAGKTTLLHILANVLNGDFERFAFLLFDTIEVRLNNNQEIRSREYNGSEGKKIDVTLNEKEIASFSITEIKQRLWRGSSPARGTILPVVYFPALRTLIEVPRREEEDAESFHFDIKGSPDSNSVDLTDFARSLFGDFVPFLSYSSLQDVSQKLPVETLEGMEVVNTYLNAVNRFLVGKQLILHEESPSALPTLLVKFGDAQPYGKIPTLSAGERQIATLLYSVTHMSEGGVVLIDEPELSLHVDWQHWLISEMVAQLQDGQIIVCTHSPMIGDSKYEDQMVRVGVKPTSRNSTYCEAAM